MIDDIRLCEYGDPWNLAFVEFFDDRFLMLRPSTIRQNESKITPIKRTMRFFDAKSPQFSFIIEAGGINKKDGA